jgi:thiamine kinase-like enzyme
MYKIYPNITQKIKALLKKINLKEYSEKIEEAIKDRKRFYRTSGKTKTGKKVFLKTLLAKELGIKNRFLNEINFLKKIKENKNHPLAKFVPQVLDYSLNFNFPYLLESFLPGKAKKREDKFSQKEIKKIAELIVLVNSSKNIFNFIPKKPLFGFSYYKKRVFSQLNKLEIKNDLKRKIKNFIKKNQKIFYKIKPKLTHGDFSEANLLFTKRKIKLVDWEHVHLRNPLYDLAGFWLKRRERPKEQKILVKEYLKKGGLFLDPLFKLAIIEVALQDLILFQKIIKTSKSEKAKKEMIETLKVLKEIISKTKFL